MNDDRTNFTTGSIPKKLIGFMVPVLGALVLQAMYGAVDILVVGQFGTTEGISGVSTGSNVINFVIFVVTALSMGITVLIGQYLGEGRNERIGKVIGGTISVFIAAAVVLAAVLLIFARPIAVLMKAPAEAAESTVTYIRICGGGIVFIIAYNVIAAIFRGLGDSRMPLILVAIACVINIAGDLLLIAVFKMNVAGAAIATVAAQAISAILSLLIIRKRKLPFSMSLKDIGFNAEVRRFIHIGAPIALQEIMVQISFLALCAFVNRLGLNASSGYGVANKVISFVMLVPSALFQSMSSFIAQNVGAGLEARSRKAMVTGMIFGCSIGVFVFTFVLLRGELLAMIFTSDPEVIKCADAYLCGFALEALVTPVLFSFMGYFNGHAETVFVMAQSLGQVFIVRLPVSYFMSIQPDASLTNIGFAMPAATSFGIILNVLFFIYYTKKIRKQGLLKKFGQ